MGAAGLEIMVARSTDGGSCCCGGWCEVRVLNVFAAAAAAATG